MKTQILILFALCTLLFINCSDESNPSQGCGDAIILDTNYDTATGDDFNIEDVTRIGNCLIVTIGYGGGCGEELISYELLGSTAAFPVSFPAMLEAKIIFDDNDDCEAWVTKDLSFDLLPLEEANYNNINITIEGWNETLEYSF